VVHTGHHLLQYIALLMMCSSITLVTSCSSAGEIEVRILFFLVICSVDARFSILRLIDIYDE